MKGTRTKKEKTSSEKLKEALLKKALGYDLLETTTEYVGDESGEIKLSKKKVVKKNVPPDIVAIKMLIDGDTPIEIMTTEELEKERERLIKELNQMI